MVAPDQRSRPEEDISEVKDPAAKSLADQPTGAGISATRFVERDDGMAECECRIEVAEDAAALAIAAIGPRVPHAAFGFVVREDRESNSDRGREA